MNQIMKRSTPHNAWQLAISPQPTVDDKMGHEAWNHCPSLLL